MLGSRLQLTSLARGMSTRRSVRAASRESGQMGGGTRVKHNIKRVDRLLGNERLHEALPCAWGSAMQTLLKVRRRPLVLVDWTGGCQGSRLWTLSAALAAGGRALRVYEDVVPIEQLDSPEFREHFLARLQAALPPGARVIVVTDAGFRIPFLEQVLALGWDYVVRVRGRVLVARDGKAPVSAKRLCAKGTSEPRSLGPARLATRGDFRCAQVVLYRAPSKGRKAVSRKGTPLLWSHSRKYARSAREGWLLVTSLSQASAREVCELYAKRMSHEEAFRDLKCPRFGMGLAHARTRCPQRLAVLCLIGAIVALILHRIGQRYARTRWAHSLYANTERSRCVLSVIRVGRAVIDELLAPYRHLLFERLFPL